MEALNFNRLAFGSNIEGKIKAEGDFYVAGKIDGELEVTGNGILLIEPTGEIIGTIKAKDIQILGKVSGTIQSLGQVTIKASGHVTGTVQAKALNILPGAIIESSLDIEYLA
jgi:cytoskeletal protein CcmA (bactofilin family)